MTMKPVMFAALLLALSASAHAETCTGRVKIDPIMNELAGGKIVYVGGCMFLPPALPKQILRSCPAGSYCRVEGVSYSEGEVGPEIDAASSAIQIHPYQEGMRDWREGQCFRARPYADDSPEQAAWIRGYHAGAKKYSKRDMAHCHLGSIKGLN
jgi:hypothetical protein